MTAKARMIYRIRKILGRFPFIRKQIQKQRLFWRRWSYQRRLKGNKGFFEFNRIKIEPEKIKYALVENFNNWDDKGKVIGGNWDKNIIEFNTLPVYQSFCSHFIDGMSWNETQFYQINLARIESGEIRWNCSNQDELDNRYQSIDKLYKNIDEQGYKAQNEISETKNTPCVLYDEIMVCIGRDGELVFQDGRHRLCIAKILKLVSVPAQITVRHKVWQSFRDEILAYAQHYDGKVYAPLLHPDLADIPSHHSHERFENIKNNLPVTSGDLLDIGSHWGYFCHQFEDLGFNCFAVETSDMQVYFLEKLKQAQGKHFHVIKTSIFDYTEKTDFDVVLALYIFHHFLKTREKYNQLIAYLGNLNMKYMILGTHAVGEPQMVDAYRNYQHDEFADFIIAHSCLNHRRLIGKMNDRHLYILSTE